MNLAGDCIVRLLNVTVETESCEVTQLHYTGWPDHGIPDDIDVILGMLQKMREIRSKDTNNAPIVVHCR